jgi:mono/diheme cytochrome c family protein
MRPVAAATAVVVVVVVAVMAYYFLGAGGQLAAPGLAGGRQLYAANCAGCHGVELEGQPDWMLRLPNGRLPAPPHDETGHTWHHSDEQLFTITKFGLQAIAPGYESDMPAFEQVLTDDEISSILDYIRSSWPERERAYQAERSKAGDRK